MQTIGIMKMIWRSRFYTPRYNAKQQNHRIKYPRKVRNLQYSARWYNRYWWVCLVYDNDINQGVISWLHATELIRVSTVLSCWNWYIKENSRLLNFLGFLNYMYMVDASCIFSDLSMNNLTTIPDKAFLRYNQLVAL